MPSRRSVLVGLPAAAAGMLILPQLAAAAPARPLSAPDAGTRAFDQTPINITTADVVHPPHAPRLYFHYPTSVDIELTYLNKDGDAGCGVRDAEETVEAGVEPGVAWVSYQGVRYDLLQFHFHTLSEHRVDGDAFPMEQHYVHRNAANELLVVGLFLRRGGHHTVQDTVLDTLPAECGPAIHLHDVDLRASLPHDPDTWRYTGSLTTAPFTPGVNWHVITRPKHIETSTVAAFQSLFPSGNARPVQPIGNRVVRQGPTRKV